MSTLPKKERDAVRDTALRTWEAHNTGTMPKWFLAMANAIATHFKYIGLKGRDKGV